jgi:membrane protease YdiL (CAAX protease family)
MGIFIRDGRLRAGWRVTLYLLVYLLGLFLLQIPLLSLYAILYVASHVPTTPEGLFSALLPANLPLWFVTVLKLFELALVLVLTYLWGRFLDRRRFVEYGFRRAQGWRGDLILGLALGAAQMALILATEWAAGWLSVGLLDSTTMIAGLGDAVLGLVLFVLVAVGEELTFRGYVQTNLQEGTRRAGAGAIALVLSSLLFGIFHAMNPNLTWMALLNLFLAGMALGYGYLATGNLWLPIAYHLSWNTIQGPIFGLAVSGVRYGGLLALSDRGPASWVTGGAFGPEGGLVGTLVLLTAFPVFWWWGRRRAGIGEPTAGRTGN